MESLDLVSGLTGGYSAKLLSPVPIKTLGRVSLGLILQTLGLRLIAVEDMEALSRVKSRFAVRERKRSIRSGDTNEVVHFALSRRRLGMLGRKGGKIRAQRLTPEQRSES